MDGIPAFHREVYEAARQIPAGTRCPTARSRGGSASPGPRARSAGPWARTRSRSSCRVIASWRPTSRPAGFSAHGGVETKARLLAAEGFTLATQPSFRSQPPRRRDARGSARATGRDSRGYRLESSARVQGRPATSTSMANASGRHPRSLAVGCSMLRLAFLLFIVGACGGQPSPPRPGSGAAAAPSPGSAAEPAPDPSLARRRTRSARSASAGRQCACRTAGAPTARWPVLPAGACASRMAAAAGRSDRAREPARIASDDWFDQLKCGRPLVGALLGRARRAAPPARCRRRRSRRAARRSRRARPASPAERLIARISVFLRVCSAGTNSIAMHVVAGRAHAAACASRR